MNIEPFSKTKNKAAVIGLFYFFVIAMAFWLFDGIIHKNVYELAGQTVHVTGAVTDITGHSRDTASYQVNTEISGVRVNLVMFAENTDANHGDVIEFEAVLFRLRDNAKFPERSYNYSKGILLGAEAVSDVTIVNSANKTPVHYIRDYNTYIKSKIMTAFPNDNGGLLCAVFLGDKSFMSDDLSDNIRTAGAAHYTAVSGLHMTMITHMFLLVFALTPFRKNRYVKFIFLLITVIVLAIFFNMTKSFLRAAIMLIIVYSGEVFLRKGNVFNSLGFALLIILIFEPYACYDAGLIMSFTGTYGVGVVAPTLLQKRKFNVIIEQLITSTCAAVCVLPAAAIFFKGTSLLAPITSVLFLPFFTIAAGSLVLFLIFGGHAEIFLFIAGVMSRIMNGIINTLGSINKAWVSLDYAFINYWLILAVVTIAVIWIVYKEPVKTAKSAVITICCLAIMICTYNLFSADRTYIEIHSDSVHAQVIIRQSNTETIITTSSKPAENTINLPELDQATYDINGRFTLDVRENEQLITIDDYMILLTRSGNSLASGANIIIASGWVRNKREFNSEYVVYVSKSMLIEYDYELSPYYEPVMLILKENNYE
ncbi:MAG: ComEC/Rec2 family competence protein [Oscillospiraceae bacterium]|nr:ComEC/Rec2 family competence protein [Oscillospiraceae bacterium]